MIMNLPPGHPDRDPDVDRHNEIMAQFDKQRAKLAEQLADVTERLRAHQPIRDGRIHRIDPCICMKRHV